MFYPVIIFHVLTWNRMQIFLPGSYYNEALCLSCSKVLKEFWERGEICAFLLTKSQETTRSKYQERFNGVMVLSCYKKSLVEFNVSLPAKYKIITVKRLIMFTHLSVDKFFGMKNCVWIKLIRTKICHKNFKSLNWIWYEICWF